MKNKKQKIALFTVGLLLVVSIISGLILPYLKSADNETINNNQLQEKIFVPDFTFTDKDGNEVQYSSFAGKPVVINFWSIYCPYCLIEMEDFNKLVGEYGEDVNFVFMNVKNHQDETVDAVEKYLADSEFSNIATYYDTNYEACYMFGINAFPITIYIDSEGYFYNIAHGMTNYDSIKTVIEEML